MKHVETKVQASGLAAAVSGVILYMLQRYVFRGDVPADFQSLIYLAVPGVIAWGAGWLAPHTPRPDLGGKASFTPPAGSL